MSVSIVHMIPVDSTLEPVTGAARPAWHKLTRAIEDHVRQANTQVAARRDRDDDAGPCVRPFEGELILSRLERHNWTSE